MKTNIFAIAVVVVLVCGCGENSERRMERFKREAQASQLASCSNAVVGLRGIVRASIDDMGNNPAQWTGEAVVEFVNVRGGVERTNLPFYFRQQAGGLDNTAHVVAFVDEKKMYNETIRELQRPKWKGERNE
jgi:hypothetical protein